MSTLYRMTRRVLMAEVSGVRVRGRSRLGCMGGVKVVLGSRGMVPEYVSCHIHHWYTPLLYL